MVFVFFSCSDQTEPKPSDTEVSNNKEVITVLSVEVEDAIERSFNILRSRIDRFGVTQPNIQRLETAGRILVELPGLDEPMRIKTLLGKTAILTF